MCNINRDGEMALLSMGLNLISQAIEASNIEYTSDDIFMDSCPECGSDRTYLLDCGGAFKCEECNLIVDDDYWMTNQPKLKLGKNYPSDDE